MNEKIKIKIYITSLIAGFVFVITGAFFFTTHFQGAGILFCIGLLSTVIVTTIALLDVFKKDRGAFWKWFMLFIFLNNIAAIFYYFLKLKPSQKQ